MFENKYDLLFGTDPEFFLSYQDNLDYDKFISHDFVISSATLNHLGRLEFVKEDKKHPVILVGDGYKFIMDGVATELNTDKPYSKPVEMYDTIQKALDHLEKFASNLGLTVYKKPVCNFDYKRWWNKHLSKSSLEYQGMIFGCDADEDAFNIGWSSYILDATTHPYRYGGGHIHISGNTLVEKYPLVLVRLLAILVGNYCIQNTPYRKEEKLRGKYYGKPGKHRIQQYSNGTVGVEYRTPSNAWCSYDYNTFEGMFKCINKAMDYLADPDSGKEILDKYSDNTIKSIKNVNGKLASSVLEELDLA